MDRTPYTGQTATQMHHARKGVVTPEMARVAEREERRARSSSATRWRAGAWSSPPTCTTRALDPMAIGINALCKINANIGNSVGALATWTRSWRSSTSRSTTARTR